MQRYIGHKNFDSPKTIKRKKRIRGMAQFDFLAKRLTFDREEDNRRW